MASGNRRKNNASGNSKKIARQAGMDQLQEWIERAKYESYVDPYRGLQELLDNSSAPKSPWRLECTPDFASKHNNNAYIDTSNNVQDKLTVVERYDTNVTDIWTVEDNDTDLDVKEQNSSSIEDIALDKATELVATATLSACPSLLHWTLQSMKKRKGKKDETLSVGRRPMDSLEYRCSCDYNPFCLLSLGGALEDALLPDNPNDPDDDEVLEGEDWQNPSASEYSSTTRDIYQRVRRSVLMNVTSIRDYLEEMVENVDVVVENLQVQHSLLYFMNPLVNSWPKERKLSSKIHLALPPGIENLGATCYLNTQLQCLAQNLVFLRGILSWQCAAEDRMSNVIRLFQDLLARMSFGPYNTVNTLDFSNALGLDHHEQQDPNEFSRLFLERMHESFQTADSDLADLLPMLFRGETSFETLCQNCGSKSIRKEHFMDLNLPIVDSTKKSGIGSLLDFVKPKKKSVDLCDCLEEYGQAEHLEGDNQYYCSRCASKQNATRHHKLTSLPNVLNLQLIRYVYNRVTLMKTKVTKAVALPQCLIVEKRRYRLCAIMSHQGSSAYSGHYTAEAMDWSSGQWYSFNDEKVKPLSDGPKSSYFDSKNKEDCEGSSDAYNLYYVHESFLNQSVLDALRGPFDGFALVKSIAAERSVLFGQLSEMCLYDAKVAKQLKHRRNLISNFITSRVSRSLFSLKADRVWIDSTFLIRFFSCKDQLQDVISQSDLFAVSSFLCKHKKLHPRVARKGKFLPRAFADFIVQALEQEKKEFIVGQEEQTLRAQTQLPITDVVCPECSLLYKECLASKLQRVVTILKLREALEPSRLSATLLVDGRGSNEEHAYIISRKFATWFRNTVDDFAIHAAKEVNDSQRVKCEQSLAGFAAESAAEGLDGLDPTRFLVPPSCDEGIIRFVNGRHGFFKNVRKQSYCVVSGDLWLQIKALFPFGIELKYMNKDKQSQDSSDETYSPTCLKCLQEPLVEDGGSLGNVTSRKKQRLNEESKRDEVEIVECLETVFDRGVLEAKRDEVEIVECLETVFDLRVLEANVGSDIDALIDDIALIHGNGSKQDHDAGGLDNYLRRSLRKRKQTFPIGCFCDEDVCKVDFSRNVASLRLTLLEKCCSGSAFQLNHTVYLAISCLCDGADAFTKQNTKFEILNYATTTESLMSIYEQSACEPYTKSFDASRMLLIRVAEREPTLSDISDEEIFDHLISLAHGYVGEKTKRMKTTRVERGFNGTFLLNPTNQAMASKDSSIKATDDHSSPQKSSINKCNTDLSVHVSLSKDKETSLDIVNGKEPTVVKVALSGGDIDDGPKLGHLTAEKIKQDDISTTKLITSSKSQKHAKKQAQAQSKAKLPDGNGKQEAAARIAMSELVDSIVNALKMNPDIMDCQNQPMIVLAAEQALQSSPAIKDKAKLIDKAYEVYLELTL